jgi:Ca2+:H+ antiporter
MFQNLRIGKFFFWMLLFIPISIAVALLTQNKTLLFITSILAIIPLARILGYSTKEIALQANPTVSGILSATFGNIIELIIAVFALKSGLLRVVEASIIGSIIGNLLLLIGLSIFIGGLRYKHQHFNSETAGVAATMLIIAVVGLTIPSVYAFVTADASHIDVLSDAVSIVLALTYVAGLIFTMLTHRDMFDASDEIRMTHEKPTLTKREAGLLLLVATAFAALESEFLVQGIQSAVVNLGITQTFIGVVIIAIVTNIAEKSAAISFALEDKLNLAIEIGTNSAIQIALFVVPILVLISQVFGFGFNLSFTMFEVVAVVLAVMIINHLSSDGRCNWLEGAQLISVYCIIAIAFFFI